VTPPLSLTISIELAQPLPDQPATDQPDPSETITAHRIGHDVARHLGRDARLVLTSADPDRRRISWTIALDSVAPVSAELTQLEDAVDIALYAHLKDRPALEHRVTELQALTMDEVDRRLAQSTVPEVVGIDEVAELLGVSRATLFNRRDTDPAFPPPIARGVWLRSTIEVYARAHEAPRRGRPAKPRPESD
jgi:predicted DNA-binding transcriptional regulator AlpA